ncbi:efflux RND transporter periplasmic adaptor subunit [Roseateles cellulosilyticus]|uniref:Efflux RND transporter periplasmic adaptor subunit n=1 Tax=Pelomonas cellulosilytica TaxID=2906762 RepID=A0ABS8XTL5_9BURK|nr:efflux RND transporter periplasmic adaptor subunit [Pelomonas sp. P8]MCE4555218.1 efflux RND transporter periplasmic adaptor subunit [Pelomonas sp. P8]
MRLASLLLLLPAAAIAQAAKPAGPAAANGYDCLIEPNQRIEIRSPTNALIDKILVERGSAVKAGDTLVLLDGSVEREALSGAQQRADSEAELRVARARADYAREKFRRREDLREQNYISTQDRDESQAELRVAEAELALAVDNRRLAGIEARRLDAVLKQRALKAPFSGIVTDRLQHPGELAFTGEGSRPILKMAQTNPLRVEVVLPVSLLGQIKAGRAAEITPEAPLQGRWQAQIKVVDRVMDSASGSFGVRLELPNPNGEIPAGVRCKVRFL